MEDSSSQTKLKLDSFLRFKFNKNVNKFSFDCNNDSNKVANTHHSVINNGQEKYDKENTLDNKNNELSTSYDHNNDAKLFSSNITEKE